MERRTGHSPAGRWFLPAWASVQADGSCCLDTGHLGHVSHTNRFCNLITARSCRCLKSHLQYPDKHTCTQLSLLIAMSHRLHLLQRTLAFVLGKEGYPKQRPFQDRDAQGPTSLPSGLLSHYLTLWLCPLGDHTVTPRREGSDCMLFHLEGRWGSKVSRQRRLQQRPLLLGTARPCPLHAFPSPSLHPASPLLSSCLHRS